jgi:hypothetical protein
MRFWMVMLVAGLLLAAAVALAWVGLPVFEESGRTKLNSMPGTSVPGYERGLAMVLAAGGLGAAGLVTGGIVLGLRSRVAAVVAGVLAVGVGGLWVRSYWVGDHVYFDVHSGRPHWVSCGWGIVAWGTALDAESDGHFSYGVHLPTSDAGLRDGFFTPPAGVTWLGFSCLIAPTFSSIAMMERSIEIPLWAVMAVLGLPGAARGMVRWRKRRRKAGLCEACKYDLRGTAAEGACPECGAARAG